MYNVAINWFFILIFLFILHCPWELLSTAKILDKDWVGCNSERGLIS